jgi:signal peptidase I
MPAKFAEAQRTCPAEAGGRRVRAILLSPARGGVRAALVFAEPFQIPSSSMVPTLEVGDYILVNKFTMGHPPAGAARQDSRRIEPQRGDVVVFFPPHMNKTYYIKRVIGLAG